MNAEPTHPRVALLAGVTGLIGRELLPLLLNSAKVREVHVLVRRPLAGVALHPKMHTHTVDFARLPKLPAVDDAFIALGTTIKVAGSEAAFRRVDFDFVVNTARATMPTRAVATTATVAVAVVVAATPVGAAAMRRAARRATVHAAAARRCAPAARRSADSDHRHHVHAGTVPA